MKLHKNDPKLDSSDLAFVLKFLASVVLNAFSLLLWISLGFLASKNVLYVA